MDIFSVLTLLGGLALFLYGMEVMGDALKQRAGGQLKSILERLTANPLKGFSLGLIVTAIIQSSSATTVMAVGFVNSGIMQLRQAIGVIIGANVGTSVTAWILSLTGIQGDSFFISLLKPSSFAPILGIIGIALHLFSKSNRHKTNGTILLGFTALMYGMEIMSGAVAGLAEVPAFAQIMVMFSNPILGLLAGLILTAIIQSSSASVGILQAISLSGIVSYGSAIPIILGQNIGTCVTALISAIGAKTNAKRVAMVHLYFNIIGTIVFMAVFYSINALVGFSFFNDAVSPAGIAIVHSSFNVFSTILLLPMSGLLERLARLTIRNAEEDIEFQLLEDRFLSTPSIAVAQCWTVTNAMAELSRQALLQSITLTRDFHGGLMQTVMSGEEKVDVYEDKIGTYLTKLSSEKLTMRESREISKLLHCIGDFERISDHAVNIAQAAEEIHDKKIIFSPMATQGLEVMRTAVEEITNLAMDAFIKQDLQLAFMVEPLEQVVDLLKAQLKAQHVERLQTGECTTQHGFVFSDLLINYERVADHCSNIAVCLIQLEQNNFDTHEYLNSIKTSKNVKYLHLYEQFKEKYALSK